MTPNGEVHPAAQVFPMMTDDELDELAADIKANGQQVPIVLLPDGVLLDGRNRMEACKRAKVKPVVTTYGGGDPVGYVVSININRRHMTKGARAMAVALTRVPEEHVVETAERENVTRSSVAKAVVVKEYAPELADVVLAGGSLNDAYAEAQRRKREASSTVARIDRLRTEAVDLADQVDEERLSLEEAEAAARARQEKAEKEAEAIEEGRRAMASTVRRAIGVMANPATMRWLPERFPAVEPPLDDDEGGRALAALTQLLEMNQ
jgi:ParB-like chromosome segregation protein Spo0J